MAVRGEAGVVALGLGARARPVKVAEWVAQSVASYILDQGLQPGDALPNERIMTEELGVGRATLREGLRLLESQGVILIRTGPGGGPMVREQRPDDLANSLTLMLQLQRVAFSMVVNARAAVDPEIARLAALNRSPEQLAMLRTVTAGLRATAAEPPEYRRHYERFNLLLAEASGNVVLLVIGSTLRQISATIHDQVEWGPRSVAAGVRTHERLLDAIAGQQGDVAYREAADHIRWYHSYFERRYPHLLAQQVRWVPTP
jgi:GntR family transcriptional repressor for pyruvate dehydrogenase complex